MSKADILRIPDYLGRIVEAIERIHRYVSEMSEIDFIDDEKTQDAVVRNFEIIGEAAHNIERYHQAYAAAHPEVPWTIMYTMRNRVAHGYFKYPRAPNWPALERRVRDTIVPDFPVCNKSVNGSYAGSDL